MPLLRMRSDKDLKATKLRKSPRQGTSVEPLPAMPPLPHRSELPPQLPLPDFSPSSSTTSTSPSTPTSELRQARHRRSQSISTLISELPADLKEQPWRSREAWQALHARPPSPLRVQPSISGSPGWMSKGGGALFGRGGLVIEEVSAIRGESTRRGRTETPTQTRRRAGTAEELKAAPSLTDSSSSSPRSTVVRSHTDGDLSKLALSSPSEELIGSIIDHYSPIPPAAWTPGTAAALYRQKSYAQAAIRTTSPISEWNNLPSPAMSAEQHRPSLAHTVPNTTQTAVQYTPRTSSESHYPPTMISDRSTIASSEESTVIPLSEHSDSSRTPTPPRGSVDVPTSPFQSPLLGGGDEKLPALLPPPRAKSSLGDRKLSFTSLPKEESPIPWGRKSPHQYASRVVTTPNAPPLPLPLPVSTAIVATKTRTKPSLSSATTVTTGSGLSSVPQTPITPPETYTYARADVPHTPSPPHMSGDWLSQPATPISPIRARPPIISARGSSVRHNLMHEISAHLALLDSRERQETILRSASSSSFRDALHPPPIPDRASSAPRGAGAGSPPRPGKSPKRLAAKMRGGVRRPDSYASGWSKDSATSGGSGSSESRNSRGGWI